MKKILLITLVLLCLLAQPVRAQINLLHDFKPTDGATPVYANLLQVDNYLYGMTWRGGDYNKGIIFRFQTDGSGYTIVHSFAGGAAEGESPYGSLIEVAGTLYGMTQAGGANSFGTVFKINPDGSDFTLLHSFSGGTGDGSTPYGSLVELDGVLFGMTTGGGASYVGTVFKIGTDGSGFTLLHSFAGGTGDGQSPMGSLLASGGTLYGMTGQGGASYQGTIFKINPDGSGYSLLRNFTGGTGDGENPKGTLIESGGVFYGMTYSGGANSVGTVFKIDPDGSDFALLHSFSYGTADGRYPIGSLVAASGVLYGMAKEGGAGFSGVIFALNTDGSNYSLLRSFSGGTTDGKTPQGSLILLAGELFGLTQEGGTGAVGTVFKIGTGGSGYSLLHNFLGWTGNGNTPYGSLVELGGVLYGMTAYGGASSKGTVFKINPDGSGFAVLHSFAGGSNGDGENPSGSLLALDGVLYGMTRDGGVWGGPLLGTVFKINPDGSGYALLHTFTGSTNGDGDDPVGSLVASGGELYGMTQMGGTSDKGAIFKIHPDGSGFALLHSFAGGSGDGRLPRGSLVETDGVFFGMTFSGGTSDNGTIFHVHSDGSGYTLLHSFDGGAADGAMPSGSLLASGGALYGMTYSGGQSYGGSGTIFRIDPDGSDFSLLHIFTSGSEGGGPYGSLIETGGALFGMTGSGGSGGGGTLFKIDLIGSDFTVLHGFAGGIADGLQPRDSLIVANGVLYGMTPLGGKMNSGVIFSYGLAQITLAISGTITIGGTPIQGIGMSGLPGTVATDASGFYTGAVNYGWSGTVTPTLAGYTFIPVSRIYSSVTSSQAAQDYTAALATYTVSGTVLVDGSPLSGVVLSGLSGDPVTNASGIYTGTVAYSWSGTVTPVLAGYTFSPSNRVYTNVTANQTEQNYTATAIPDTLTLTSPNGGESWTIGSSQSITWASTGTIANVDIDYSTNSGSSWTAVVAGTANDGAYAWTVPNTPSTTCLVRVSDTDGTPSDNSNAVFTIVAAETVSAPTTPAGPATGTISTSYDYSTGGSTSNLGHTVQYNFDWDDGSTSGWLAVGTTTAAHSWAAAGTYNVRAMARCVEHTTIESSWSTTLAVIISAGGTTGVYNSPAQYKVLPEVIWANAAGGGTWMSSVQVNDVTGGSQVYAYYNTANGRRGPFLLWDNSAGPALSSAKYSNLLETIDGLDAGTFTYYGTVGAVEFITQDGSHTIHAAARTVNGSYAKTFTAVSLHDANTADTSRTMIIPNLVNNATYRSSCGFFNPTDSAVTVDLKLRNASNTQVGTTITKTFAAHEFIAYAIFTAAGVPYPGTSSDNIILQVTPTSGTGKVVCFGASANNTSNDPAAHVAVQNGSSYDNGPSSLQVMPEAVWASASGGGTWVTEVQIVDATGGSQVSVYFNYIGGVRRGPFTLWTGTAAGSKVKCANILQQLGTLDGSYTYYGKGGAVEFATQDGSHAIQVTARTVNGNYAKTFPGLNVVDAETADTARVMLVQNYTNNVTYRSTCGFYNPTADSITVEYTLLSGSGAQIGSQFSKTLVGHDFVAFSPFAEAGVAYPANSNDNVILRVRPTSGTGQVMCFGASANNASNDPASHLAVQGD